MSMNFLHEYVILFLPPNEKISLKRIVAMQYFIKSINFELISFHFFKINKSLKMLENFKQKKYCSYEVQFSTILLYLYMIFLVKYFWKCKAQENIIFPFFFYLKKKLYKHKRSSINVVISTNVVLGCMPI